MTLAFLFKICYNTHTSSVTLTINMNKLYTLNLVTLIISAIVLFVVGMWIGVFNTPKENIQEKQTNLKTISNLSEQLRNCQSVIEIDRQALLLSAELTAISGKAFTALSEEDIPTIEKATDDINTISDKLVILKDEVTPLAEKCYKE